MPQKSRKSVSLSIFLRTIALFIVLVIFGMIHLFTGTAGSPTQAQSAVAGQAVQQAESGSKCRRCHKATVESFGLDLHGKSAKFLKDSRGATCESCHGDGAKHIKSAEAKDILNPAKETAELANESC